MSNVAAGSVPFLDFIAFLGIFIHYRDRRSLMYEVLYFTKISRTVCLVNTHILMYFMSNVTTSNVRFFGFIGSLEILMFDTLYENNFYVSSFRM